MGKSYKKSNRSAKNKNETLNRVVLDVDDAIFGRAVKKLGNARFRIQVPDAEGHGTEADASIPGKSTVRIEIGDVVVVGRNESSKHVTYEILGSCDKKTVQLLRKANRLHPSLFSEEDTLGDDLFDRSEDAEVKEEETVAKKDKANKPVRGGKLPASTDDDDDVNIDAI
jgi:translation initiation factor IF-1